MRIHLFFSWQMETDLQGFHNKPFLYKCICDAISEIQNKGDLKGVFIEPHQGLENIPGTPEVAQQMYEQVDKYELFIGDVTTVQRIDSVFEDLRNKDGLYFRYGPNYNVYGEYNRALGKYQDAWKQVILLSNSANISPEQDVTVVPFDTRGRRWAIDFYLPDDSEKSQEEAKNQLMGTLKKAIYECTLAAIQNSRNRYEPFDNWFNVRNNGIFKNKSISQELVEKYKKQITEGNRITCISGKVGIEKTLLALLIFEECKSANNCLYIDNARDDYSEYKSVIRQIFRNQSHNQDIILIIDNCSIKDIENIIKERKIEKAGNRVIALMNQEDCGKKIDFDKITYIDVTADFIEEMDSILIEAGIKSKQVLSMIKQFCENKTELVKIIATENKGHIDGEFNSSYLSTILLGVKQYQHEREIMRVLSLFDCIGWKDDKATDLQFIICNKNILPIDVDDKTLIAEARSVIVKNIQRGLIIERGREISVSPKNIAYQFLSEWLNEIDEIRFRSMLSDLTQYDHRHNLFRELHDQFRGLSAKDDTRAVIKQLFKPGGMFDNIEILNTEDGSLLFAGFAEVYPNEACDLLVRVLNTLNFEELRNVRNGRRNLVWLIEKMAFRPTLFEKAAILLLRFGIAENENIGNNATEEFVRLFPMILPATAATLDNRLNFLQKQITYKEYRPLTMQALKRALVTRDNYLLGGAETLGSEQLSPYYPSSLEEGDRYIGGILKLIEYIVEEDGTDVPLALDALHSNIIHLCLNGWAKLSLETVRKVAIHIGCNWEQMQETMAFFKDKIHQSVDLDNKKLYDEILDLLTKQDIVSRFKRVEKETRASYHFDYEKVIQEQKQKYSQIAYDIYSQKALNRELLKNLIEVECISTNPFGETLAHLMTHEEQLQFVKDYISIINESETGRMEILCDFILGVSDILFMEIIPVLQKSRITWTMFSCLGLRNVKPSDPIFKLLNERIEKGESSSNDFLQYWKRIKIGLFEEGDYVNLFTEVLKNENSFPVVVKMASFLCYGDRMNNMNKIVKILTDGFINYCKIPMDILHIENALHVSEFLLNQWELPQLAQKINRAIITYAKQYDTYFSPSYEIESIYRLLMTKYFDIIWPELAELLLSDGQDFMAYYNMKRLLGVDLVNDQQPIILEGNHFTEMLAWCEKNQDVAPARLAGLIKVEKDGHFTNEALQIIDKYADKDYVLDEIGCSLNSFVSIGSVIPEYENRINVFKTLLDHHNPSVREWAQSQVNSCMYMIERETLRETEKI